MRQMAWLRNGGCRCTSKSPNFRMLHLRVDGGGWRPYTAFPQYAVADYKMEGISKGWATYQRLRESGDWELVETAMAESLLRC